jgi:hypothetical protein
VNAASARAWERRAARGRGVIAWGVRACARGAPLPRGGGRGLFVRWFGTSTVTPLGR